MRRAVTIAAQRSGTKFFGDCLNLGETHHAFGEITNTSWANLPSNMLYYAHQTNAKVFGATNREVYEFLDTYFDYLDTLAAHKSPHVDVMYNQLGGIVGIWSYPKPEPLLLRYFREREFAIVHIVRDSIFDAFRSTTVRLATGVTHSTNEGVGGELNVEMDLKDLETFARGCLFTRKLVRDMVGKSPLYTELSYPDFIADNTISIVPNGMDSSSIVFGRSGLKRTSHMQIVNVLNEREALDLLNHIQADY